MLKHLLRFGCCTNYEAPLTCVLQSRSFEIKAMQEAMKSAKYVNVLRIASFISPYFIRAGSTHRAWQELPRHLRRRAASHNVRRVPLRLRRKSRTEVSVTVSPFIYIYTHSFSKMDPRRRKILGRSLPKLGKSRRELRSDTFKRRQSERD
jgi:ribonuclease P/MRP protein subunit POP1